MLRVFLCVAFLLLSVSADTFKIAVDENYPPWTATTFENGVPAGVSVKMIERICEYQDIPCEIVWLPSSQCLDGDGVGDALRNHEIDGCLDWDSTSAREDMGLTFSNDYSTGPASFLIADPGRALKSFSNVVKIGYTNGFDASPDSCVGLTSQMHNNLKTYIGYDSTQMNNMLTQLDNGGLDYVLWANEQMPTLPVSGLTAIEVVQDGGSVKPIRCAADGLALMMYPTNSNAKRVASLTFNFNQGLNTIRRTEYYSTLCYGTCPPANCIQEWQPSSAATLSVTLAALLSVVAAIFLF